LAVILYAIAGYVNGIAQTIVERKARGKDYTPLPDLGYSLLPHIQGTKSYVPDGMLTTAIVVTIIYFAWRPQLREKVFRRLLFLCAFLFLMRAVSISVTILDPPPNDCVTNIEYSVAVEGFLVMFGIHHTCADLVFSGHTVHLTILALIWQYYSDGSEWKWLSRYNVDIDRWQCLTGDRWRGESGTCNLTIFLVWFWAVSAYVLILCTRFHYSLDVFVGLILAIFVFKHYHHYIETVGQRRGIISRFFCWFEFISESPTGSGLTEQNNDLYQPPSLRTDQVESVQINVHSKEPVAAS
jgi:hypothetical protein